MEREKRLLSNTVILAIGTFASKFLVFFMMPLYTRYLLPEEYSTADLIAQTANLLIPLACAGITNGVFRFAVDKDENPRQIFSSGLSVLLIASLLFVLLSPLIGLFATLSPYVWLVAVYVIAANLHAVVAQYIRAKGNTLLFSLGGLIGTALTIAFNILFLVGFRMGVEGYVLSVVLGDVVVTLILFLCARLWRDFDPHTVAFSKIRELLKYSVPLIPTTIFWWITSVSDRFLVIAMKGDEVNGLYAAAYKVPTLITLVCGIFIDAWQFSAISESDKREREDFFGKVFAIFGSILFMGASAVVLFSKAATRILLAENYFESWRYIPVLAFAMVFYSLVSFMGSVYTVEKRSVNSLVTSAAGAITNIVLNILLIPMWSAMGAAVATFISYFVVMLIRMLDTRRFLRFSLSLPLLIVNTVLLGAQCVITVLAPAWWLVATVGIFALILAINGKNIVRGILQTAGRYLGKLKKS